MKKGTDFFKYFSNVNMTEYTRLNAKNKNLCSWWRFSKLLAIVVNAVLVVVVAVVIWHAFTASKPTPVIFTSDGPVQGHIKYSRDGQEYWEFLGIPYAKPPVGELKFQPPVPVEPWENVKQVTSYPPNCAQWDLVLTSRATGELDCLFLNVFVNVANSNNTGSNKPVMAYIHGGGFIFGGSSYVHPEYVMDRDVVLVVMNYRLGPYGFLNLQGEPGENVPRGNMGLLDQNMVLQWIQKNIVHFGGDPQRVTLIGQSAGAVSTHLHMISPMSRGLFQKAILQSGTALTSFSFSRKPIEIATEHARKVGCSVEKVGDLWKCYENMDKENIVKYQESIVQPLQEKDLFGPTIDGTFLKQAPEKIFKSGNIPRMPIMIGVAAAEGGIRTARFDAMPELIPKLDENWVDDLENVMLLDKSLPAGVALEIRNQYFGNMTFADDLERFKSNFTVLMSDGGFFYPAHKAALYNSKIAAPTYMYFFNYTSNIYPGPYSLYGAVRKDDWIASEIKVVWSSAIDWVTEYVFGGKGSRKYGVNHAEDVYQLVNILGLSKWVSFLDSEFSRGFVNALVDFANDTQPLTFRGIKWPAINDQLTSGEDAYTIPYMLMDNEEKPIVIPEPFGNRIKFWANLENRYGGL